MAGNLIRGPEQSKSAPAPKGGKPPPKGRRIHSAMAAFHAAYPNSTAAHLAVFSGASMSFCEKVLSGAKQPGAPMLEALLRSDVGKQALIAIMGAARPAWWVGFSKHLTLARLVKAQEQLRAEIEAAQRDMATEG